MPSFVYRAADATGQVTSGSLDCESEAEVVRTLERRDLTPLSMKRSKAQSTMEQDGSAVETKIRLRTHELLEFTRQLKVMLASGVSLLSTLGLLRQRAKGDFQRLLDRIATDIQRGSTLSDALAAHPRTFDPFYIGTMRAGEAAGVQTETLDELIAYYERRATLRRELINALTYPAIVILTLIGACVVMLVWVVPQFEDIFASSGTELPLPTRVLLSASALLTGHAWVLLGAVGALVVLAWLLSPLPAVRAACGAIATRLPLLGTIVYLSTVVQFTRMIALLERAGLPLLETLKVVENMLISGPVKTLTGDIRRKVATGSTISSAIIDTQVLPELVEHMVGVGEETGRIDETLSAAASHYEDEMRIKLRRMVTALEPLLTLAVSLLVLGVAMAIFLPMWETNSLMLKD